MMALMISMCVVLLLESCRAQGVAPRIGSVAVESLPQVIFGASVERPGFFNRGLSTNEDSPGSFPGALLVPFSDNTFGDFSNLGRGSLANPDLGRIINPFINNFGRGPVNSLGSTGDFFGNSFGGVPPFGFNDLSNNLGGPLNGFSDPLGALDNSFGIPIVIGSFPNFGISGQIIPLVNDFGNGQLPGGFVPSNGLGGFLGRVPGSINTLGSTFSNSLGSEFLPITGATGSVNPFISNIGSGLALFFDGNDNTFHTSSGVNSRAPGRF
ncbi:uncharacterized protein [Cherax quadricarinatus]|uniref:uncharacterized protein n=1 Tax=Cherax quadricarinatus TaxID=27406 RepID=UPI002378AFBB|nr:uncharacterized protein LOC128697634 [Cherax quadricarinatus]